MADKIPSGLLTPPTSAVLPPVETRPHQLPFEALSWKDFERLCLRLAQAEADVEYCRLYGLPGQDQEGIDIYARHRSSGGYHVYQCKRVQDFGPSKIKAAVDTFLTGSWPDRSATFVLCTSKTLEATELADEIERQRDLLKAREIDLLVWDRQGLSDRLKDLPEIVDDFFGRPWVEAFCGNERTVGVRSRLDATAVAEFRRRCATFNRHTFQLHDPGLPSSAVERTIPLEERYVVPDVYDFRALPLQKPRAPDRGHATDLQTWGLRSTVERHSDMPLSRPSGGLSAYRRRESADTWLGAAARSVILAGPGGGKSSLLRFVAIDLLRAEPQLGACAQRWAQFLPVWVPFPLWVAKVAVPATSDCSLRDVVRHWLHSLEEEDLWPLIEQALDDKRLLLLVDGLDEWTDEDAARIALDRLQLFLNQRDLPAILAARPEGFGRLGMATAGWQLADLSDLSPAQQAQLTRIWFVHWLSGNATDADCGHDEFERQVGRASDAFLTELRASPDLLQLSAVPLLLCLLLYLSIRHATLPRSRFRAYQSLIDHLVVEHPRERQRSAGVPASALILRAEDVKRILARLAYQVQQQGSAGMLDIEQARVVVEAYLKDPDGDFAFVQHEARRLSHAILDVGENSVGLLVKRSPTEVGFFHRAFQEYLAADYVSGLALDEQLAIIQSWCVEPQWREVLLGIFHLTSRRDDIRAFIDRIQQRAKTATTVEQQAVELLLAEVAFGDFNCSASLARSLAAETLARIETDYRLLHRERLLGHALDGLRSTRGVRDLLTSRLEKWFPCRSSWRAGIFAAIANWRRDDSVVDCLLQGILDEEPRHQRAAGEALARLAGGDGAVADRLIELGRGAPVLSRAAAIESLLLGWADHADVEAVVAAARASVSPVLRLVAMRSGIAQGRQKDEDREELLRLGTEGAGTDWAWRQDIATALIEGWPRCERTKQACLQALRTPDYKRPNLEHELSRCW